MKPVGLTDPRTGKRPHAVVQLRQEDQAGTAYNLVGFQTRMKHAEQKRVFRMIPGLENAEFLRLGTVHRNTFVRSPDVLSDDLSLKALPGVYLAGQITGVEGYVESAACGMALGIELAQRLVGEAATRAPETTALGALLSHLRRPVPDFQPSNAVWSMFPPVEGKRLSKGDRRARQAERALADLEPWLATVGAAAVREALARPA
jgi:methylenetetrahydrofolate--tRNA-(uracil-5-)-methyltransferase